MRVRVAVALALLGTLSLVGLVLLRHVRHSRGSSLEVGQCTWYALERAADAGWHIRFDHPWGRHGRAWWEKVTNASRGTDPRPDAIMVLDAWRGNSYGHVAYVESVCSPNEWTITHANMAVGEPAGMRDRAPIYRAVCERAGRSVTIGGLPVRLPMRGFLYRRLS